MRLKDICEIISAEVLTPTLDLNVEVSSVCGCDLMSDVLAYTKANTLLLTGLASLQVIRTAEMADLIGIVFVRGKRPEPEVIELAIQNKLPLLTTHYPLYETAGLLFQVGLPGCYQLEEV
ncbi:MAG: hypothetical protein GX030_08330 [Firmicutes bacterium]|nr:hypothetical protein [Bacillota bacterium]